MLPNTVPKPTPLGRSFAVDITSGEVQVWGLGGIEHHHLCKRNQSSSEVC
jgi:hypothetical protein